MEPLLPIHLDTMADLLEEMNEMITFKVPEVGIQVSLREIQAMSRRQIMESMPGVIDPDVEERWIKLEEKQRMELYHKLSRTAMRVEFMWMKQDEIAAKRLYEARGIESDLVPCSFDDKDACVTMVAFTAFHPVDFHEYGLRITLTEVTDTVPYVTALSVYHAFYEYLRDHSMGKDANEPSGE